MQRFIDACYVTSYCHLTSAVFHPLSSVHSNSIPSGDGQRNGSMLICVTYVLVLGGDPVLDPLLPCST